MGVDRDPDLFPASGRRMSAEELSCEVLKSLLHDVEQRTGTRPATAVVTVPAAFDLAASEATRRAAALAGLESATLLPEPAAAAMAYGFQLTDTDARWLIYDLGGGTFDAAVIEVRDGEFRVARHAGDNVLGGKLVDWRIVEDLLLPALAREVGRSHPEPRRGDPVWRTAVAKLKRAAEIAKIQVSRSDVADIFVDVVTPSGERVDLEFELTRRQVEEFTRPVIVRSVNLCQRALREAGLSRDAIDRVVLVGGPTQAPLLRELLADPTQGLGIRLDHSQDPLTVVARGAAVFAGSRRSSVPVVAPDVPGRWSVQLEYSPMGPDTEPLVVGRLLGAAGTSTDGLRIEVHEPTAMPPWRSGAVEVDSSGLFTLTLRAERGRLNSYRLVLTDATGRMLPVEPDRLTYTVGAVETDPPLAHSVGVGLEDNRVEWLLQKGRPLPARHHVTLRTTVALSRGRAAGLIRVPVVEGEHPKADRNRRIGSLEVNPGDIARDVPVGSEIDLTIEIDASRVVTTRAYLPVLDAEFEQVMSLRTEAVPDRGTLERQAGVELERLADVQDRQVQTPSTAAAVVLERIEQEQASREIRRLLAAADDPDAAATARQRILDLRAAVDDVEDSLEWPATLREAQGLRHELSDLVREHGTDEDRRSAELVIARLAEAEEHHDLAALRRAIDQGQGVGLRVLDRIGHLQFMMFEQHTERLHEANDPALARVLHERGRQAVANGDVEQLRVINRQLWDLFDDGDGRVDAFSTVRRG
jgi:molecular chaperone DnaK